MKMEQTVFWNVSI